MTKMPRMHLSEPFSPHALTPHQGITSLSSATEKIRPRPRKISRLFLRSTTFRFTQFTEHSPPAVRDSCECLLPHAYWSQGSDGTVNFWDKDARTRLKGDFATLNHRF